MVVTKDTELPEEKDLTVQEINVSWPILQAASVYIGKSCEWYNNEFMLCREEEKDPRKCLEEGKQVTACALQVFQKLKKHCMDDVNRYADCLENSSGTLELRNCRKTQALLDDCVLENLHIERPSFGYFCEQKIHDTKRPKPERRKIPPSEKFPNPSIKLTKEDLFMPEVKRHQPWWSIFTS